MRSLLLSAAVVALLMPSAASAKPPLCTPDVIEAALTGAGHQVDTGVNLIRCGDVTGDGATDVVFTVASGGTAGDTHFGVLLGREDGSNGRLVLYRPGYKIGVSVRSRHAFEVIQPHYRSDDANCCPSSFRQTRYTWTGSKFKKGKTRALKTAPARFYRA